MNKLKTDTFSSLSNHFLIAMPQLESDYFAKSVVYIWSHSEQGALGVVINLPLKIQLSNILKQLNITGHRSTEANQIVFAGGPVEQEKGFILHDSKTEWDSTIAVTNEINLTTSKDILDDIGKDQGPENYLIALGCSGWEPGQLEQEIMDNAWLTCAATKEVIFSADYANKPNLAAALLGFDLSQLTPEIGRG